MKHQSCLLPSDKIPLKCKCEGSRASSQGISGCWNLCVPRAWVIFDPVGLSELIPRFHKQLAWENGEGRMKGLGRWLITAAAGSGFVPSQPCPSPSTRHQTKLLYCKARAGRGNTGPLKTRLYSAMENHKNKCLQSQPRSTCPLTSSPKPISTWPRWENACGRDHPPPKTQSQAFIWAFDCKALRCNSLRSAK